MGESAVRLHESQSAGNESDITDKRCTAEHDAHECKPLTACQGAIPRSSSRLYAQQPGSSQKHTAQQLQQCRWLDALSRATAWRCGAHAKRHGTNMGSWQLQCALQAALKDKAAAGSAVGLAPEA